MRHATNLSWYRETSIKMKMAIYANLEILEAEASKPDEAQRNEALAAGITFMPVPALVFATELALKGILEETGVKWGRTHNLRKIYRYLKPGTQMGLEKLWETTAEGPFPLKRVFYRVNSNPYDYQKQVKERTAEHQGTLQNFREANREQYNTWRYPHNAGPGVIDMDIRGFIRVLETLTEYESAQEGQADEGRDFRP